MGNIFADNSFSIGNTPLVKINRMAKGAQGYRRCQDRGPQPGLFGEVPDRGQHDLDSGKRGTPQTRHGNH